MRAFEQLLICSQAPYQTILTPVKVECLDNRERGALVGMLVDLEESNASELMRCIDGDELAGVAGAAKRILEMIANRGRFNGPKKLAASRGVYQVVYATIDGVRISCGSISDGTPVISISIDEFPMGVVILEPTELEELRSHFESGAEEFKAPTARWEVHYVDAPRNEATSQQTKQRSVA